MERTFKSDIMHEIKQRWSARAIDSAKIPKEDILALLEAARYAPSCFNEQPWRFIVAEEEPKLSKMRSVLSSSNQVWANSAPVLILIASKKIFLSNGKDNYWNMFDAGTAWGYLSLEAQRRGLIAHAMGGFDREAARDVFNISQDINILAVVAVGKYGNKENLPTEFQNREFPGTRKEIEELII